MHIKFLFDFLKGRKQRTIVFIRQIKGKRRRNRAKKTWISKIFRYSRLDITDNLDKLEQMDGLL